MLPGVISSLHVAKCYLGKIKPIQMLSVAFS